MNNRVNQLFSTPGFFDKPVEEQLNEISKVDQEFFLGANGKPVSPETQYKILFDAQKGNFKPQTTNGLPNLEQPDWLERNASDFYENTPLPLLENLANPDPLGNTEHNSPAVGGLGGTDIGEVVLGPLWSVPRDVTKGIWNAGKKLIEGDPGAALGQGSSLLLPAAGRGMQKLGWNRMRSALGPSTGGEIEVLNDIGPRLMEESGLSSLTQRSLEEKLIGKGRNIADARSVLAGEKAKLKGGTGTIDADPLKQATEDVAMGTRPMKDTVPGLGDLPADPDIAAKARNANDLINYYQSKAGTSLVDPLTGVSKGLLTERDLQTFKEAAQERARRGKLFDVRQGTVTPETEVYGGQAALADDILEQISPSLGEANERMHALLTAGETVKANRLGRIEGFAPPSEVSMVRNPGIAAASMGFGPLLGKLFRGVTTPFNTTGGVGLDRMGGALSKLSPQEVLLLSLLTGDRSRNPLETLGVQ